jgi:hypothetical protein
VVLFIYTYIVRRQLCESHKMSIIYVYTNFSVAINWKDQSGHHSFKSLSAPLSSKLKKKRYSSLLFLGQFVGSDRSFSASILHC